MNHIGDTNKMVDTPRMDRVLKNCNGWYHVPIEMARELERELNAAEKRIKRLEKLGHELRECASQLGWTSSEEPRWLKRAEAAVEAWDKLNKETKQ